MRYRFSTAGLIVLVLCVIVILAAQPASLSRDNVDQRLQQFSTQISEAAGRYGRESHLSYGDISMHGWGLRRSAVIPDLKLQLTRRDGDKTSTLTMESPRVKVEADNHMPGNMWFVFDEPFILSQDGQPVATVTFSKPPRYGFFEGYTRDGYTVSHALRLPGQINITTPGGTGSTVIRYEKNPVLRLDIFHDKHQRVAMAEFHHISVLMPDQTEVRVADVEGHFGERPGQDDKLTGTYTLAASDISLRDKTRATKDYHLDADLVYVPAAEGSPDRDMHINRLVLADSDFSVKVDGQLLLANDDPLPSGVATITIDKMPAFLTSELLPESARRILASALTRILGQPAASLDAANIPLKRDKNGTLYLGANTFEAVATAVLADMVQSATPAAGLVPPAAAPIPPEETAPTN